MRTRSKVALGGGIVSFLTVGGLVSGSLVATTATLVVTDPLAPRASADSLSRFDDCEALRQWYVDHTVAEVGPYGWTGPLMYAQSLADTPELRAPAAYAADAGSTVGARPSSGTGTNTQEAEVDEPDLAKTDGHRVVRLVRQRIVVVSDVTGVEPRELGRVALPADVRAGELLLVGDHALVSQRADLWEGPGFGGAVVGHTPMPYLAATRIIDIDLSDGTRPRVVHDDTYSGTLVSLRQYGDTVRIVTTARLPQLPWVMPHRRRSGYLSEREATRRNRQLLRATTIAQWLPSVVDNLAPRSASTLVECSDVFHPSEWSGDATTTVTTYDVDRPSGRRSIAVSADAQVVYSSADRLYVASTVAAPWRYRPMSAEEGSAALMPIRPQETTTQLHAFALDGDDTRYVGSGHVAGSVRDRWSLDEHDGMLRVAWTRTRWGIVTDRNGESRQRTRNGITVLAERNGALVPTGEVTDLGRDEIIQSVRWFDDFAVLVTFRQMDPVYTIDLTDPARPRELGQLEIPGYSGYLHPIGDDRLLALGVDATDQGRSLGAQAAVFDVRDLTDPRRISRETFGRNSWLPALEDPRGLTWLPDRRTALTTVTDWRIGGNRLVALDVAQDGTLTVRELAPADWSTRTLPLADGRVAVVDDRTLRVVDLG